MIIEVNIPDIGANSMEITDIKVIVGDKINVDQSILVLEGDKASIEVPSVVSGVVKDIKVNVGDIVVTGDLVMTVDVGEDDIITSTSIKKSNTSLVGDIMYNKSNTFECHETIFHATPSVRHFAREYGVNLANVQGTGIKGRILREDIQGYVKSIVKSSKTSNDHVIGSCKYFNFNMLSWPKVNFNKFGKIEIIKLNRIQKISGDNLYRNWLMVPHVTQFDEADITDLEKFRTQQNIESSKKKLNVKVTLLVFVIKAVAKALEELTKFNSSLSEDGCNLILKKYINIGVAIDTVYGLFVPVIRDVNKKGIIELSKELSLFSNKAHAGNKLTSFDMQGGGFTISSLGGVGGTSFTPIVNVPEVAILGLSKSYIKPVWNGKKFLPRLMLPLSLSYDHRVINGVEGVKFINIIRRIVSDIRCLVM